MSELVKIAIMNLDEAKSLQKKCEPKNVELVLNHNETTCTRGCSVTVEVHAKEADIPVIQEIYSSMYEKLLEGHDVDLKVMHEVFDPAASSAICPACGFEFDTKNHECPDCGLVLA